MAQAFDIPTGNRTARARGTHSFRSHPTRSQPRFPDRRSRAARPHQLDRWVQIWVRPRPAASALIDQMRPAAGADSQARRSTQG